MKIEYSKQSVKAINAMDRQTKQRIKAADVATPADLKDIQAARAEFANGETVSHNAINWE